MTNDGDLANRLTHPRYEHEKELSVLVAKHPDPEQLNLWRRGVVLEDGFRTGPAGVYVVSKQGKGAWLDVILKRRGTSARSARWASRLVCRSCGSSGFALGNCAWESLKPKEWRY